VKKSHQTLDSSPVRPTQSDVPFAENRFKGQSESLTKELFKKAQEALLQKKQEE
jgi:hypothetical protein